MHLRRELPAWDTFRTRPKREPLAPLFIFNRAGHPVGQLAGTVEGQGDNRFDLDKAYDFVVLCASALPKKQWWYKKQSARSSVASPGPPYGHMPEPWVLRVMLVEKSDPNSHMFRRVALGSVDAELWQSCSPHWETVILG